MLSTKARKAADTIFEVFGMTQLRIKPSEPCFAGERSNQIVNVAILLTVLFHFLSYKLLGEAPAKPFFS